MVVVGESDSDSDSVMTVVRVLVGAEFVTVVTMVTITVEGLPSTQVVEVAVMVDGPEDSSSFELVSRTPRAS